MVKLHLPHMYMIFVDNFKGNNNPNLLYNTPWTFQHFWDHTRTSQALRIEFFGLFQLLQVHFLLFFWLYPQEDSKSSGSSRESYNQLPHHFCATVNNACRAQPKLFGASRRNALTMDLKTKKICEYFFWKLQIISVELYNQYWPWNKNAEEVDYEIREKERKTRDAPRSKPKK